MSHLKDDSNEQVLAAVKGIGCLVGAVLFLPGLLYGIYLWHSKQPRRLLSAKSVLIGTVFSIGGGLSWFMFLDRHPLYWVDLIRESMSYLSLAKLGWLWWMSLSVSVMGMPTVKFFRKKETLGVRVTDFQGVNTDWKLAVEEFFSGAAFPLGIDVKTLGAVLLGEMERCSHLLGIGATGSGKSSLMILMILHDIWRGRPCIIIDPKGDGALWNELNRVAKVFKIDISGRIKVFDMSVPKTSARYNPLKHGNANQLKDRIMEALNWSEQYYQSISADYLTVVTATAELLNITLTLDYIMQMITDDKVRELLKKRLNEVALRKDGVNCELALSLHTRLGLLFSKDKADALSGMVSQLALLNNPTFGPLLSFQGNVENELDLREIRKTSGIAYFRLDTLGNADSARRLGRMIVEDIKSLSSEVYKTEPDEKKRVFFPIYIDEFGSFVSKEFIEMLKQARGSRMAMHLFCQGLEDLDIVSPQFRRQVISNTLTKIAFRCDDNATANEFCATAGTFDALEQSHQVDEGARTGKGNLRETKQMKVEHDVIKNLCTGQAVVISKSPTRVFGLQIYHSANWDETKKGGSESWIVRGVVRLLPPEILRVFRARIDSDLGVSSQIGNTMADDGSLLHGFDYVNQCWVQDGKILRCGHQADVKCKCFGRIHEGQFLSSLKNGRKI